MRRVTRYCFVVFTFLLLNGSMVHSESSSPWMKTSNIMTGTKGQLNQDKVIPSGTYVGFISAPHLTSAELIIGEGGREGHSFTLRVKGEKPQTFVGRITFDKTEFPGIPPGTGTKKFEATIRFGSDDVNKYFSWDGLNSSLKVEGEVKQKGIALRSLERNKPFVFETCLPHPGCKEQPQCQPCVA